MGPLRGGAAAGGRRHASALPRKHAAVWLSAGNSPPYLLYRPVELAHEMDSETCIEQDDYSLPDKPGPPSCPQPTQQRSKPDRPVGKRHHYRRSRGPAQDGQHPEYDQPWHRQGPLDPRACVRYQATSRLDPWQKTEQFEHHDQRQPDSQGHAPRSSHGLTLCSLSLPSGRPAGNSPPYAHLQPAAGSLPPVACRCYSTVTLLARLRGLSTLHPRATAA